jgi:hypothetical protein
MSAVDPAGPLADTVAEARRLVAAADGQGLLLGGVAIYLPAPDGKPRIPRERSQVGDKVRWYQQPEEEQSVARP